jgi:hypothetical protein
VPAKIEKLTVSGLRRLFREIGRCLRACKNTIFGLLAGSRESFLLAGEPAKQEKMYSCRLVPAEILKKLHLFSQFLFYDNILPLWI